MKNHSRALQYYERPKEGTRAGKKGERRTEGYDFFNLLNIMVLFPSGEEGTKLFL